MAGETMNPAECGLNEQKQKRYVDINPAIEFLEGYDNSWGQEFADGVRIALHFIKKLPVADVQEVKHGKWRECRFGNGITVPFRKYYICSHCNHTPQKKSRYCPYCGAKMDGKENKK